MDLFLGSSDPTLETCASSCRPYGSHPVTWARPSRSAPKDLDHELAIDDDLSVLWDIVVAAPHVTCFTLCIRIGFLTRAWSILPPMSAGTSSSAYISSTHRCTSSMLKEGFPLQKRASARFLFFPRALNAKIICLNYSRCVWFVRG